MSDIKKTFDYDQFKLCDSNRKKINHQFVKKLAREIGINNLTEKRPIDVDDNMLILDGQHRFLACKSLNLPIYYRTGMFNEDDMVSLNFSRSWLSVDYLNYYVKKGYPEYIKLQQFIEKTGFSLNASFGNSRGSKGMFSYGFTAGGFRFDDLKMPKYYEQLTDILTIIEGEFGKKHWQKSSKFLIGITSLLSTPHYDHEYFLNKLPGLVQRVCLKATTAEQIRMWFSLYNHKVKSNVLIYSRDRQGMFDE